MATNDYHKILQELLSEFGIDDYHTASDLKDDLGLDSLSLIQLVMHLNQHLEIDITSHEITPTHFGTIHQLEAFLKQKAEGR